MARFGKAFGKTPDDCKSAEHADHVTNAAIPWDWQVHCHLAASASIFFEQPTASKHNGVAFSGDEMKYLALEYWGNFGKLKSAWDLAPDSSSPVGKYHSPAYFKPGEAKTPAALAEAYQRVNDFDAKTSKDITDAYVKAVGGEAALKILIDKYFGELAAKFYKALIDFMRVQKHALMANMRAYEGSKGADEIWNHHALFWYEATYQEHNPAGSDAETRRI